MKSLPFALVKQVKFKHGERIQCKVYEGMLTPVIVDRMNDYMTKK